MCLNFTSLNYAFRWISGSFGFIMKQDKAKRRQLEGLYCLSLFTCTLRKQTNEEEAQQARDYKYGRLVRIFTGSALSCFCSEIKWSFFSVSNLKFSLCLKSQSVTAGVLILYNAVYPQLPLTALTGSLKKCQRNINIHEEPLPVWEALSACIGECANLKKAIFLQILIF